MLTLRFRGSAGLPGTLGLVSATPSIRENRFALMPCPCMNWRVASARSVDKDQLLRMLSGGKPVLSV